VQIDAEEKALEEAMLEVRKDKSNPLNNLIFGYGQPVSEYWAAANFNMPRSKDRTSDDLFWIRMTMLVP